MGLAVAENTLMKTVRGPLTEGARSGLTAMLTYPGIPPLSLRFAEEMLEWDDALRAALERAEKAEWALRERMGLVGTKLLWNLRDEGDAALANLKTAEEALGPLLELADAVDRSGLDECRPDWGDKASENMDKELYTGRGGRSLLTLGDAIRAREAIRSETTPLRSEVPQCRFKGEDTGYTCHGCQSLIDATKDTLPRSKP